MKRLNLILIAIVLLISGCATTEKQAVEQSTAPSSAAENITAATTITNTSQTPEDVIQSATPLPHGIISKYHPIIINGELIGGYDQKWLNEEEVSAFIQSYEEYKLLNLSGSLGVGIGGMVIPGDSVEPYTVDIQSSLSDNEGFLGISCDWSPMPRTPVQQSNSDATYKNIVAELLSENGLQNVPVNIVQNYRIDLDGDGQDEVLLLAQNIELPLTTINKGSYSLLILRKIVNGQVENIFLEKAIFLEESPFWTGQVLHIKAIADLNGDGVMEIVVACFAGEASGYEAYELKDNQVETVLYTAHGAF